MSKHTINDLYQMQALPLSLKIRMTQRRIRDWVEYYGKDGVYVSFSGGKDSTVLLYLVREIYPEITGVYVDTGLEYPEVKEFVRQHENVEILRPKMNFRQVIMKYGYPFISKEVADLLGIDRREDKENEAYKCLQRGEIPSAAIKAPVRYLILQGKYPHKEKGVETSEYSRMYNKEWYKFFLDAPFEISAHCCSIMKKAPMKNYAKRTGKMPMTAQMASESRLRTMKWLENGCNGFDMKSPISNPLSFWTEQDVLEYIYCNHIPVASVYGKITADYGVENPQGNTMELGLFDEGKPLFETTGCNRTGCVFCGFGCHREKSPNRWETAERFSNPAIIDYMLRGGAFDEKGIWKPDERGLGFWFVIEWINVHGNLHIIMPHREKYLEQYITQDTKKTAYGINSDNYWKQEENGMKNKTAILTFTVAECGEYHSLGEYYEGITTLDEAVDLYLQMPSERMHGIPAIGINLHVEGTKRIQDSQVDILSGDEIDVGMIRLMPEFGGNPQVLEAVNAIIERFPEKEVIDY